MESISKTRARNIAVAASFSQGVEGNGKRAALKTVQHLGYVQIDTISVIERAHHHVFWSRQPSYESEYIDELLSKDRTVFEYWAHAVSYLPIEDYRYYLAKFESHREPATEERRKARFAKPKQLFGSILERIEKEGPLASRDFELGKTKKSNGWWDWKPAKRALEYLYLRGDLMISSRKGFQRVYDLTERVLPEDLDTSTPSSGERAEFQIRRALKSMGIAREREIVNYLKVSNRVDIKRRLWALVESGAVTEVEIAGIQGEVYYTYPNTLEEIGKRNATRKIRILSPFDNLVIQRERIGLLFDFKYTIECYVPAPKRVYGYFVCPILWGSELVGRIDMKADRKAKRLVVNSLHIEPAWEGRRPLKSAFKKSLDEFAAFNGCGTLAPLC